MGWKTSWCSLCHSAHRRIHTHTHAYRGRGVQTLAKQEPGSSYYFHKAPSKASRGTGPETDLPPQTDAIRHRTPLAKDRGGCEGFFLFCFGFFSEVPHKLRARESKPPRERKRRREINDVQCCFRLNSLGCSQNQEGDSPPVQGGEV